MSIVPWFHGDDALPIGQRQRLWLSKPKRHRQRHACIVCMTKFQRKHASWHPEKKKKNNYFWVFECSNFDIWTK